MAEDRPTRTRPNPRRAAGETRERVLDVAERLVQQRGFNAFSYADIAAELGITKASLHYHFPGKAELGEALVVRYTDRFAQALAAIDARTDDPRGRLDAYLEIYVEVLKGKRMCLCGMLAADYPTLPEPIQAAVRTFFDVNETWLADTIEGCRTGATAAPSGAAEAARAVLSVLQGAMLLSRTVGDPDTDRFRATGTQLISSIVG